MSLIDRCQGCRARRHENLSYIVGMQSAILHSDLRIPLARRACIVQRTCALQLLDDCMLVSHAQLDISRYSTCAMC
jgi:hypothetical protein